MNYKNASKKLNQIINEKDAQIQKLEQSLLCMKPFFIYIENILALYKFKSIFFFSK